MNIFQRFMKVLGTPAEPKEETLTVLVYLRGGQVITMPGVKKIKTSTNPNTGKFESYTMEWCKGRTHKALSLNLDDISAITAEKEGWE